MATSAMDRTTSPFPAENGADTGKDDDDSEPKMPQFDPGELAPFWASPQSQRSSRTMPRNNCAPCAIWLGTKM